MYNRYIPQSDGSYQRRPMPDPSNPRHQPPVPPPPVAADPPCEPTSPPPKPQHHKSPSPQGGSVMGFLRQLLPKDFDTSDFLIVLLILLMAGEGDEERNTALLTLALYLFM